MELIVLTCPLCDTSVGKKPTALEKHFQEVHSMSSQDVWNKINSGPVTCACGCGKETKWIGWKRGYARLIRGHNGFIYSKTLYSEEEAKAISEKRTQALTGQPGWSRGLTKETDERIKRLSEAISVGRQLAFDEGRITIWHKGLTKETDERVKKVADNAKEAFANGSRVAWHKGLTEKNDDRVLNKNNSLREAYENGSLVIWSAGKTVEEDPRIKKTWEHRDPQSEYVNQRWSDDEIRNLLSDNVMLELLSIDNYRNSNLPALNISCKKCGWSSKISLLKAKSDRCPKCNPAGSNLQHSISNWIEQTDNTVIRNVRGIIGRQELDIYIPSKKIAVEVNGLYWHNEASGKDRMYHQKKTDACKKQGISLIHIFEDEWRDKQEIVKSILSFKLNTDTVRIHTRQCELVELSSKEKIDFFIANHLDGDTQSSIAWGLKYEDEIVYALSLRKPFHKKFNNVLELARCCPKLHCNVPGAANKLIGIAAQHAKDAGFAGLLTYVDTRLGGDGYAYLISGFTKLDETHPRYWWTDCFDRFNRFIIKAKDGKTQTETAAAQGLVRIWGCRNISYVMMF